MSILQYMLDSLSYLSGTVRIRSLFFQFCEQRETSFFYKAHDPSGDEYHAEYQNNPVNQHLIHPCGTEKLGDDGEDDSAYNGPQEV